MPVSSNATPTTTLKIASILDMKPMSSAVASAVSVTQMFRAPFEIGWPLSSFAASASSFVPSASVGFSAD